MGSVLRQQYHVVRADGTKTKKASKKWYIQWKRADGRRVRKPAYTDRAASLQMLARKEREVALQLEGLVDATSAQLSRPIAEHIAEFKQHLIDKNRAADYVNSTATRVTSICKFGKIETAPELTKSRVDAAFAVFRNSKRWSKPFSVPTANQYLAAIKGFAQWLVDERRLADNPISGMEKTPAEGEETKIRRPLSPDELAATIRAAVVGPPRLRIAGPDRAALYILAAQTGYRRLELSRVMPSSFSFGAAPEILLPGKSTKNKKRVPIPLRRDVAVFFEKYLKGRPADKPVWRITKNAHTADMIRADMDAAGVTWRDGIEVADFHSLRETFVTELALAGVVPKVLQQLARHSTVDLTMNKYAKPGRDHRAAAVESAPAPGYLTHALTPKSETNGNIRDTNSKRKHKSRLAASRPEAAPKKPNGAAVKRKQPRK